MEKKRPLSGQTSVIGFLKLSSGTVTSPPILLLVAGAGELGDSPVVQEEVPPPKFSFVYFIFFCEFFISTDVSDVLLKHSPHFYMAGKSASANGDATDAACLGTTYDVTSGIAVFQSVRLEFK
jgi:hypothetical protein